MNLFIVKLDWLSSKEMLRMNYFGVTDGVS